MKLLVSVRDADEALLAVRGGADFIDCKEPNEGALGGLPISTIVEIVDALRRHCITVPSSATIGDVPMNEIDRIAESVQAVAACGVDYVKVGIERTPDAPAVLNILARSGRSVVPVFIADLGLEMTHVDLACALGFPGVMVDTAAKRSGSLFDVISMTELRRFVQCARENGVMVGAAGALRFEHQPMLSELAPDFAGFRTAVCVTDRESAIDPGKLRDLVTVMRGARALLSDHSIA